MALDANDRERFVIDSSWDGPASRGLVFRRTNCRTPAGARASALSAPRLSHRVTAQRIDIAKLARMTRVECTRRMGVRDRPGGGAGWDFSWAAVRDRPAVMQDAGCGMQDAGCRMQDAGCGCAMWDAGYGMQDARDADAGCRTRMSKGPVISHRAFCRFRVGRAFSRSRSRSRSSRPTPHPAPFLRIRTGT
jgi:hypothetical protein